MELPGRLGDPELFIHTDGSYDKSTGGAAWAWAIWLPGKQVLFEGFGRLLMSEGPGFSGAISAGSATAEAMAVLDAGHKSTAPDQGRPVLEGLEGGSATRFSAEHGIVELVGDAQKQLNAGDKAWLVPYELGASVNQYDYFRAAKNGKLEGFWPISARGRLA